MPKRTPLYDCHLKAAAKIVDFAGWDMPLHYGSQIQEHHAVRQNSGMFDVSHMTIIDCTGREAGAFLGYLLANNVGRLTPGKALYTCMLNEQGGVIDDLIVYKISDESYRLVVNSSTREKDLAWLQNQASNYDLTVTESTDKAMIAIQGPQVSDKISAVFNEEVCQKIRDLKPFNFHIHRDWFIARTGYTGEEGYEIILPAAEAPSFWENLSQAGITPCGLGARDTLRLEAGLNLYGADMDETVTPLESNLKWTVAFEPQERNFIGRGALENQMQAGIKQKLVGIVLEGPGVLRNHQKIIVPEIGTGEITSGSFSPTLGKGIALARVPATTENECFVEIRNKEVPVQVIKLPFVRQGKKNFLATSKINGAVT